MDVGRVAGATNFFILFYSFAVFCIAIPLCIYEWRRDSREGETLAERDDNRQNVQYTCEEYLDIIRRTRAN